LEVISFRQKKLEGILNYLFITNNIVERLDIEKKRREKSEKEKSVLLKMIARGQDSIQRKLFIA